MLEEKLSTNLRIIFGVCGCFATVSIPNIILWVQYELGIKDIQVVMTKNAQYILDKRSIEMTIDRAVIGDWNEAPNRAAPHVKLARWAQLIVVMPTSANFLGKLANGIADDFLSTTLLAAECPVVLAPAMNSAMWKKKSVQRNVEILRADGYAVMEPEMGLELASGTTNMGSMADFRKVFKTGIELVLAQTHTDATSQKLEVETNVSSACNEES